MRAAGAVVGSSVRPDETTDSPDLGSRRRGGAEGPVGELNKRADCIDGVRNLVNLDTRSGLVALHASYPTRGLSRIMEPAHRPPW